MSDRIDAWAKAVAQRISRRQLLGGMGAITAGSAIGVLSPGSADLASAGLGSTGRVRARGALFAPATASCPAGYIPCGPICCSPGGACTTIGGIPVCVGPSPGLCGTNWHNQLCPVSGSPPACVDVLDDPQNCGSCGHRCPPPPPTASGTGTGSAVCVNGVCGVSCFSGYTACESEGNWSCVAGPCPTVCNPPLAQCGGICVNLQTSSYNCGSCGHVCPAPADATGICSGGACTGGFTCDPGYTKCGSSCNDLAFDASNCGACGNACSAHCTPMAGFTAYCVGGVCENIETITKVC